MAATTTESDLFMFNTQYVLEPFGFFLQQDSTNSSAQCPIEFEELERKLFLDNDLDSISVANFEGEDILSALPSTTHQLHELIEIENKAAVFATSSSSSPFSSNSTATTTRSSNSPITRNSSFSDELNSLSLEQLSQHIAAISANSPTTTPHSNKRVSTSPLASPRRQQQVLEQQQSIPVVDSKEGILSSTGNLYHGAQVHDDFSTMGLVYGAAAAAAAGGGGGGLQGDAANSSKRPFVMQRSLSSHALGQLRPSSSSSTGCNQASALDTTMQGLHACSGSIVPSLSQLLEVKEGDQIELDVKRSNFSPCTSSMRRVCSTGDIQRMNSLQPEGQDEGGFKIGRYSLAERKERILRYRQKRSERNFNKKIKYACRKTLADSRPRVRGRFAKNEDVVDSSSSPVMLLTPSKPKVDGEYEDEVDLLLEDDESLFIDRQSSGDLSDCWGIPLDGR